MTKDRRTPARLNHHRTKAAAPAEDPPEDPPTAAWGGSWADTDTADLNDLDVRTGCRDHQARFLHLEHRMEALIKATRHPHDADEDTRARLAEALQWCAQCPIPNACYQRMTHYGYTGLAGARLLVKGRPYVPRKDVARPDTEDPQP